MFKDACLWFVSDAVPTSVDFVKSDPVHMVAVYSHCDAVIYDIETSQPVIHLDCKDLSGKYSMMLFHVKQMQHSVMCTVIKWN